MPPQEVAEQQDRGASPTPSAATILASLARAEADVAAGRVVEGEAALVEIRAMIAAHGDGEARR